MFFTLYQLSLRNRKMMVTRDTLITIEGYPRSANTYAVYAFRYANKIPWSQIAHHLHVQAQVIRSIQYKIPVILLIRHPLEAVRSLVVRHDFIPVNEALEDYCRFYTDLYQFQEGFIVAPFDAAIKHFGKITEQVNNRFQTCFTVYPSQNKAADMAVMQEIDKRNRQMDKGKVTHLYRPDKGKELLKSRVVIDENGVLYKKALKIYLQYMALAEQEVERHEC